MKSIIYLVFAIVFALTSSLPVLEVNAEAHNAFSCADVSEIPQLECEALVELYNSTNGAGWTDNTNWLVTNTPSNWSGVMVASGHVMQLSLFSNQLDGSIPTEVGNLSSLTDLRLYANQLRGSIPPELGNLTNLIHLDLRVNQLSGSIPPELGNLTMLTSLILYSNKLSGSIPLELCNLSSLRTLMIDSNELIGGIPPELGNLTNLIGLDLSNNQLGGGIPPELGNLSNLQNLGLTDDQLNGSIPSELGNLSNLKYLSLNVNHLNGNIPAELGNLSNLNHLYLSGNQLSGSMPPELGSLTNLTELWLSGNPFGGSIPVWLGNLTNLMWLSMEGNQLTGSIPPILGSLTNLRRIMLDSNELSGSIPAELGSLTNLELLWLHDNLLEGDIPSTFINLVNLMDPGYSLDGLNLDYNHLQVPPGYPDPGNPLHVFVYQKDPDWHLSQLHDFVDCGTVTEIPQIECEGLISIYNSTNGPAWATHTHWLETSTPGNWFGVRVRRGHVAITSLTSNNLIGSLPAGLCDLSNLWQLHLSNNQLSGNIPSCLGNFSSLNYLDLAKNKFTGNIPLALGNLPDMIHLYLDGNQLSGNIPSELGNLTKLCVLQLQDNLLSGNIPETFINLVYLGNPGPPCFDGLDLDYNMLNVPPGYPDPNDPLQVFLIQKDPDWQLYQGFEQLIGTGGGELSSLDGKTHFLIPAGALDGDTTFTFIPLQEPRHASSLMHFANNSFDLSARDGFGNPVITFNLPVTVTLTYEDGDIAGPEYMVGLYYWEGEGSHWTDAVTTCPGGEYTRDLDGNQLALPLCHLTEFGLFSSPLHIFLPVVRR